MAVPTRTGIAAILVSSLGLAAVIEIGCSSDDSTPATSSGGSSSGGSSGTSSSGGSSSGGSSSGGSSSGGLSSGSSGNDAGDAGNVNPKDISGLVLWLDNANGMTFDGGALTGWTDRSGSANNATVPASCRHPTRAAASKNGNDTIVMNGQDDGGTCISVTDTAALQFGTGDFAVFVVARYVNEPDPLSEKTIAGFWSKRANSGAYTGVWLAGNTLSQSSGGTVSQSRFQVWQENGTGNQAIGAASGRNDGSYHRFGGTRRGLMLEAWVDGKVDGAVTLPQADDVSQAGRDVFIGGTPDSLRKWVDGNLAEVVAYKGSLSNADIAKLDAYFKAKHAFTY